MTDGLTISGGNFVVTKDGRQVINTAGHLVMGLPSSVQSLTKSLTYPDPPKAYWYNWRWYTFNSGGGGTHWFLWNAGAVWVGLLAQEWVQDTILCAAPTVADGTPLGFLGKIRLNRTTSPSHNVNTATLSMRVPANVWIPNCGSILLEYVEFGVARTLTCMISGGNLILRQRQSVTAAFPGGGDVNYGDTVGSGTIAAGTGHQGGYWLAMAYTRNSDGTRSYSTTSDIYKGILAFHDATQDNVDSSNIVLGTPSNNAGFQDTCDILDNLDPSAHINAFADPTNYQSIYTVDVQGEFVRLT